MKKMRLVLTALTVAVLLTPFVLRAQQGAPPAGGPAGQARGPAAPPQPMSFFVSSAGSGKGADLGGLAGADAICQGLATAAGSTKTWHAYLSTQGPNAVNARDRIGNGPWYNANGAVIARDNATLHGDTIEQARIGNALGKQISLNEQKKITNGVGDMPNEHDILTGSQSDGRAYTDGMDHTCSNWTSSAAGMGSAQLGHSDKQGGGNSSWNSTHPSRGCSQENLVSTGGAGKLYCFAIN
jgi:hypothetical protein